jgi:hypothetical protein
VRACFLVNDLQLSGGVGVVVEHARQVARHGIDATLVLAREQDDPDWAFRGLADVRTSSSRSRTASTAPTTRCGSAPR